MRKVFFVLLLTISCSSYSQKRISFDSLVVQKWTKAIINLEGRFSFNKYSDDLRNKLLEKKISSAEYDSLQRLVDIYKYNGVSGTAIFLQNDSLYYLITAKHVLIDPTESEPGLVFRKLFVRENPTTIRNHIKNVVVDNRGNATVFDDNALSIFVTNDPRPNLRSFVYSSDSIDLIVVSINGGNLGGDLIKGLLSRGYVPIRLSDIDIDFKISTKDDIYSFGFPQESEISKTIPIALLNWESNVESMPFVSKGRLVKDIVGSPFFEAEIFTYHGISGGPIIRNNKLIGITHGFKLDTVYTGDKLLNGYIVYHSLFIKSSFIKPLLKKIESEGLYKPIHDRLMVR